MKLLVAVLFACCGTLFGHDSEHGKDVTVTLDSEEKFNVSWSFDGTTPSSYITFTITCRTTGWVGIGLSPNGDMTNADIIVGWVDSDGTANLLDMYATSNGAPVMDLSQDVTLLNAEETDGVTMIKFKRKLDTCDGDEDNIVTSSTTRLIYAYKDSDPVNGVIEGSDYHGNKNRGVKSLYLLESKGVGKPEFLPTDTLSFDVKVNNYSLPAEGTTYYCSFHEPPQLDTKHHVVAIEPLIDEGNAGIVHHILLYGCWGIENEHLRNNNKTEGLCYTSEMPEFTYSCAMTLHGWAVGGGTFYYPDEAGYPIGGADGTAPQYYMMEVHYDNPERLETFVDSSGLRLIYSPSLREQDAGVIPVGLVDGIVVPPQTSNFRTVAFCENTCTNQWIPEEGIHLIGYLLHTHLIGRSVQVEWYRGGEHIGVLAYDDNYDFNFQEVRHFDEEMKVLRGDTLKITCNYTNSSPDQVTYGGNPTSSEMCLAYLIYYPRQNVTACTSIANMFFDNTDPVYEALYPYVSSEGAGANGTWFDKVNWTEEAVAVLQDTYDTSIHRSLCLEWNYQSYPNQSSPLNASEYQSEPRPQAEPCQRDESHEDIEDKEKEDENENKEKNEEENGEKNEGRDKSSQLKLLHSIYLVVMAVVISVFGF